MAGNSDRRQQVVGLHRALLSKVSEHLTAFFSKLTVFHPNSPDSVSELSESPDLLPNVTLKTENSGKEKRHKHKLFGPDFPQTFLTLTPGCPGVKKFLPPLWPQENALFGADVHDFRRGRP